MLQRIFCPLAALLLLAAGAAPQPQAGQGRAAAWQFAVSGDSRNCGDVVMPAIAASALGHHPAFYWHVGDFRAIYNFDEDMQHQPEHRANPMTIIDYEAQAWPDFLDNQIAPFGSLPVFLGIGNHETIPPKTRDQFIFQFADWLDQPALKRQRLADDPRDHLVKTYFHWVEQGVDFIYLDNATPDQFDSNQVKWFQGVLARDASNPGIKTLVVGMHAALPDSISAGHSMNQSPDGIETGRRAYKDLLEARNKSRKRVYVLASHSHFYMDGIFNTDYWRNNGGVLPGWIVGTAGAVRYPLPPNRKDAREAETNVYGYLLGSVSPDGEVRFAFQKLNEAAVPAAVVSRYGRDFVHWCFAENKSP